MTVQLNPPKERECIECGRRDVWDETVGSWVIDADGDERLAGDPHCIHVWDINGQHDPIRDVEP
jgi:hypothetical protein